MTIGTLELIFRADTTELLAAYADAKRKAEDFAAALARLEKTKGIYASQIIGVNGLDFGGWERAHDERGK